jgi:hypothetical protein
MNNEDSVRWLAQSERSSAVHVSAHARPMLATYGRHFEGGHVKPEILLNGSCVLTMDRLA